MHGKIHGRLPAFYFFWSLGRVITGRWDGASPGLARSIGMADRFGRGCLSPPYQLRTLVFTGG
jgi:hypothetical protein